MEVFGAGDQVGDASRQYKRRADDFHRAVRILARFHLDGLDRRIALRIQIDGPTQGPSVAGGSNGAPGDFNVAVWRIDPIALRIGRCASGGDGAPGDNDATIQRTAIDAAARCVVAAGRDSTALGNDRAAGDGDNIGVDAAAGITAILFAGRDRAAGGFDGAAGDGGVVSGVNAIALKLCRPAGGGDVAASDDDIAPGVNAVAFTAVCGGIAAGGGQAAAAGDGEGNLIINMDAIAAAISP